MIRIKSKGTAEDGDWVIEQGEIKELPEDWKKRPSFINNLKRGFFEVVGMNDVEKILDKFKEEKGELKFERFENQKKKESIQESPLKPTETPQNEEIIKERVESNGEKESPEIKLPKEIEDTLDEKDARNFLSQNGMTVLKRLKGWKLSRNDLELLLKREKDREKSRIPVLEKLNKMLK